MRVGDPRRGLIGHLPLPPAAAAEVLWSANLDIWPCELRRFRKEGRQKLGLNGREGLGKQCVRNLALNLLTSMRCAFSTVALKPPFHIDFRRSTVACQLGTRGQTLLEDQEDRRTRVHRR